MNTTTIKKHRKANGYSQAKLSEISGIPQTTLSGWEIGLPDNHAIYKAVLLAKALKCTAEDLFPLPQMSKTKRAGRQSGRKKLTN